MPSNYETLSKAYLQTHETVQKLTFMLEEKGIISTEELAYLYNEGPKPPTN